jgi:hypothetical protein
MATYKKFKLTPGQVPPNGTLGIGLANGFILFYGDSITPEIQSEELTLNEYKKLKYFQFENDLKNYRENNRNYPAFKIMDIMIQYLWAKEQPVTQQITAILQIANNFMDWYKDLLLYQRQIKTDIKNANDFLAVDSILWSFVSFDLTDPNII